MNTWNEEQYGKMTIKKITKISGKNKRLSRNTIEN